MKKALLSQQPPLDIMGNVAPQRRGGGDHFTFVQQQQN